MPSRTWTASAVGSEARRSQRLLWRAVEAQHIASTLRLVGTLDEQLTLERVLEASKPALPVGASDLHYLLATPFRYTSPMGSRFRAPSQPGVWYGAEHLRTSCAELGYWRWRFLMDSPALHSLGPSPQTVFRARIQARCVDLTAAPFKRARAQWAHPHDYSATRQFADTARAANVEAIRYESVRDPQHAAAMAVLSPACFHPRAPTEQHTWLLSVRREAVIWQREGASFEFQTAPWQ